MSLYLGNNQVSDLNEPICKSCIGQMVTSLIPLHNEELHLLDGTVLDGTNSNYAKFYNYIVGPFENAIRINGTLINNNGVFSGFSSSNYIDIVTPNIKRVNSTLYRIKFTTGNDISTWQKIFYSYSFFELVLTNNTIYISGAFEIKYIPIIQQIQQNTTYYIDIKMEMGSGEHAGEIATVVAQYIPPTPETPDPPYNPQTVYMSSATPIDVDANYPLRIGASSLDGSHPFLGTVDITETFVKENDTYLWNGANYIEVLFAPNHLINNNIYQEYINDYGICGKFGIDIGEKTIRLPKVTGIIEYTISENNIGNITEAGIPNIYGTVSFRRQRNDGNMNVASGAFHNERLDGSHNAVYYDTSSANQYNSVSFNASRSSSIYGNNTTVQPQTIKTFNYIVIK